MTNYFILFILSAILFFYPSSLKAQNKREEPKTIQLNARNNSIVNGAGIFVGNSKTKQIGSPYFTDEFIEGNMNLKGNMVTPTMYLRYNMETDNVQFLRDGKIFDAEPKQFSGFTLFTGGDDIIFKKGFYSSDFDIKNSNLIRVIYSGNKYSLLAKHSVSNIEDISSYASATKTNRYETFTKYFLKTDDNKFYKIKDFSSDIPSVLQKDHPDVESYISNMKLDLNKEADIKKLFNHFN